MMESAESRCSCEIDAARHADPDDCIRAGRLRNDDEQPAPPYHPGQEGMPTYHCVCTTCGKRWKIEVDWGGQFTTNQWSRR
jgi:hypothetical protein